RRRDPEPGGGRVGGRAVSLVPGARGEGAPPADRGTAVLVPDESAHHLAEQGMQRAALVGGQVAERPLEYRAAGGHPPRGGTPSGRREAYRTGPGILAWPPGDQPRVGKAVDQPHRAGRGEAEHLA